MALAFFLTWILLSGEWTLSSCLVGAAVSAALWLFCCRMLGKTTQRPRPGQLGHLLAYLFYLLAEMLKAGFVVMKLVYTKGRHMKPVLVHFDTAVQSERARAALANSITLTAGTITVTAEGERFCVHALDRSLAEGIENSEFARRLRELEE